MPKLALQTLLAGQLHKQSDKLPLLLAMVLWLPLRFIIQPWLFPSASSAISHCPICRRRPMQTDLSLAPATIPCSMEAVCRGSLPPTVPIAPRAARVA